MVIPSSWLNEKYLKDILKSNEEFGVSNGELSIQSYVTGPGVERGRNFASNITKVEIDYNVDGLKDSLKISLMIKVPLTNDNLDTLAQNELDMYNEVIPLMCELANLTVTPKRYKSSIPEYLVLEDLNAAGYTMCDSIKKLDYKHVKAALIAVAKFQAASITVKHNSPRLIEQNGAETVYTHDPQYAEIFKPQILMRLYGVAKVLQTINGCEKFGDILLDTGEEFWDLIVEVFKPTNKLNVLNHGDFWTNNILFKYDSSGCISDVKLVDYQLRRFGSPAIDLLYLFWTSADDGARMRMFELLEMYRHTLNGCLAETGCPERLGRLELKEHVSKCSPIILLLCLYLPLIFPDPEDPFDVSKIETLGENSLSSFDFDTNPLLIPFKAQYYRQALPEICKELETLKIFQVLMKNKKKES
ncbi:uncharacterized protein LOC128989959 [Macrosteles quadrilineatus]|uniref:uncharacterized protein LOC128989959 n=1 Tax=Macrosteles quadrilineatus TaxID=74068 RepID=UPI0023E09764|nr:uncharacterized protein LOC128989959 [Macrosteles quadrilineatus]